jgi:hypothetical protein
MCTPLERVTHMQPIAHANLLTVFTETFLDNPIVISDIREARFSLP